MSPPTLTPPSSPSSSQPEGNNDAGFSPSPAVSSERTSIEEESSGETTSPKSKLLKGAKGLAVAVAGCAAALVAWECILQVAVESSPGKADHPALGKIEKAGTKVYTREGFSRIQLNSLGMRSPEPTSKSANEFRILMLGDSYTRADEVRDGLSFSDRLQEMLTSDSAAQPVSIVNAGKPGASPASYLYAADFHKQTFEPDSVVIQLTEHDFTLDLADPNSEFYLEPVEPQSSEAGADFTVQRNEAFGSSDPLAQAISVVAPQLEALTQLSILRVGGRNLHAMLSPTEADTSDSEPLAEDASTAAEDVAIQQADAAMVAWVVQEIAQTFPNAVLLFVPSIGYVDVDDPTGLPRNAAIEAALEAAADREGLPLLNMREDFLMHYAKVGTHVRGFNNTYPGEGHLNPTGHRLVADRLADYYLQLQNQNASQTSRLADPLPRGPQR